jgi:hypothetical protein
VATQYHQIPAPAPAPAPTPESESESTHYFPFKVTSHKFDTCVSPIHKTNHYNVTSQFAVTTAVLGFKHVKEEITQLPNYYPIHILDLLPKLCLPFQAQRPICHQKHI